MIKIVISAGYYHIYIDEKEICKITTKNNSIEKIKDKFKTNLVEEK